MNLPITGGCVCGAVRYECSAEPIVMVRCHCRDCQRTTGGPYVPAVIFPFNAFRIVQGSIAHYATPSEGGGHNLRGFCSTCGSRLTGAEDEGQGVIGVLASSLDDPSLFAPKFETFAADAQPWDVMDPTTPKFPQNVANL